MPFEEPPDYASCSLQVLGYALVSFIAKDFARSNAVFASVYYSVHVAVLALPLLLAIIPKAHKTKSAKEEKAE